MKNIWKKNKKFKSGIDKLKYFGKNRKIDNAGIILNNKVINDIAKKFEKSNISFYTESSLKSIIVSKLVNYYNEAYSLLVLATKVDCIDIDKYDRVPNYKVLIANKTEFENIISKYTELCNKIFNYDIEKNIVDDIIERLQQHLNKEEANENLKKYKNELCALGYGYLVSELEEKLELNKKEKEIDLER